LIVLNYNILAKFFSGQLFSFKRITAKLKPKFFIISLNTKFKAEINFIRDGINQ